ncbi:MAG: hypothetical protein JXB85_15625 [Anaerolineales bacterium]|nr:hypothetical protein [Anaerolineales bacterium]
MTNLQEMLAALKPLLQKYHPPLTPRRDEPGYYDLWSIKPVVIEGRRKKEVFFAALIIQKNYVGFYFMPVYADQALLKEVFAPQLLGLLKGKSCFHIRRLPPELIRQIETALAAGFRLYQERGWV